MMNPIDGLFELLAGSSCAQTKQFALEKIVRHTDSCWFEMNAKRDLLLQTLREPECHEETRNMAALALSKMHFNFGEFDKSVEYALRAIPAFSPDSKDSFTVTMVSKIIDCYVSSDAMARAEKFPRIEPFFEQLFASWMITSAKISMKELLGLVFTTKRMDLLEQLLETCTRIGKGKDFFTSCYHYACRSAGDAQFSKKAMKVAVKANLKATESCYPSDLIQGLIWLFDTDEIVNLLSSYLRSQLNIERMYATQLAIDVYEANFPPFSEKVLQKFELEFERPERSDDVFVVQVKRVLTGQISPDLYAKFLYSKNSYKVSTLQKTKAAVDGKNLILHNAFLISHSYIFCGTSIDDFLRDNIAWVSKASHWAKFTAVASLGGIYKGSVSSCQKVLESYLPQKDKKSCPFQSGGALLALGLASAPLHRHSSISSNGIEISVKDYVLQTMENHEGKTEILFGGALGLGLLMRGSRDENVYNSLYASLLLSDAVSGEGCAVGIGLLMMASGNEETVLSLLNIAREKDQKEKIVRGVSLACALIMCGRESESDTYVDEMLADNDPWIRMGGCMVAAMAYAGTSNVSSLKTLLRVGIEDVSDDVKRTAVMSIGFVSFKNPQEALDLLCDISDSHNVHVRYGVAMGLGIAGCGTGHTGIVKMLWRMLKDTNEFVRQGSAIALSMVLIMKSSIEVPEVGEFRDFLTKKIADRHVDLCTKLGCILAQGMIDAGGRNCTISLHKNGTNLYSSIASMLIFTQYWYWFPYSLCISQSFSPSCFIGLNQNLESPKCTLASKDMTTLEPMSNEVASKPVPRKSSGLVELSTTRREKQLEKERDIRRGTGFSEAISDIEKPQPATSNGNTGDSVQDNLLKNPCRVAPSQMQSVQMDPNEKYIAIKSPPYGICMIYHAEHTAIDDCIESFGKSAEDHDFSPPEDFVL